jgi:hypothetical protein
MEVHDQNDDLRFKFLMSEVINIDVIHMSYREPKDLIGQGQNTAGAIAR